MGDFSGLPEIEVLDGGELGGASAAYSVETGRIHVSSGLLEHAGATGTVAALLEEIGHWMDARVNRADTAGDEGELFSALVRGKAMAGDELVRARAEDDSGAVVIGGRALKVEFADPIASAADIATLKTGINSFFTTLDTAIAAQAMAEKLPIVGDKLRGLGTQLAYLANLRNTLMSGLGAAENAGQFAQSQLNTARQ